MNILRAIDEILGKAFKEGVLKIPKRIQLVIIYRWWIDVYQPTI